MTMTEATETTTADDGEREAGAFFETLDATSPHALTACVGWTVHDITAHLVAGAVEVVEALQAAADGRPAPATRGFEEREQPYRDTADNRLRRDLPVQVARMQALAQALLAEDPGRVIPWTGRQMPVSAFLTHARSEFAIHRWDVVGDDPTSVELLAQPLLTEHAVNALGRALLARGTTQSAALPTLTARLSAPGHQDVVLHSDAGGAQLRFEPAGDGPSIAGDAAARLLLLWGRRTADPRRLSSSLAADHLVGALGLLRGY